MRYWFAAIFGTVIVASILGWWIYASVLPRTFKTEGEVEAEIQMEVPIGSSEADALSYLRRHKYLQDLQGQPFSVSNSDRFLIAQGVAVGTRAVYGEVYPSRRGWFESQRIAIFIVFDNNDQVQQAFAY